MRAIDGIYVLAFVFAVARITRLINRDTITEPIRIAAMKRRPGVAYFLSCPWCVSVWVAGGLGWALWHETRLPWLLVAFIGAGASYATGMLSQLDQEDIEITVEDDDA